MNTLPPPPFTQPDGAANYPLGYFPPPPPPIRVVSKTGLSSGATIAHILLTCFTCGLWAPFWALHWMIASKKTVTTR